MRSLKGLLQVPIAFLMAFFTATSSFVPLAHASKALELRKVKTQELIKALQEGSEGENAAQFYQRMAPYVPLNLRIQMEPLLKDKGHFQAPRITSEGNLITFKDDKQTIKMQIEHTEDENIVTIDGHRLTKEDLNTPKAFADRLETILKNNAAKSAKKSVGLHSLFLPQAEAFEFFNNGMFIGLALGAVAGMTFGGGGMNTLIFAGLGAVIGSMMGQPAKPACPGSRQCTNGTAGDCMTATDQCCAAISRMDGCTASSSADYSRAPVRLPSSVVPTSRDMGTGLGINKKSAVPLKPLPKKSGAQ